jgi:hypothetical protein
MPFSVWEYLRERTRDAVLAGINDALDVAEQGDANGAQHEAATKFRSRAAGLLAGGIPEADAKSLSGASPNGAAEEAGQAPQKPAERPAEAATFDDELEQRLESVASQNGRGAPPPGRTTDRPRRGRPPKNPPKSE